MILLRFISYYNTTHSFFMPGATVNAYMALRAWYKPYMKDFPFLRDNLTENVDPSGGIGINSIYFNYKNVIDQFH